MAERTALVTGASAGIGAELARCAARDPATKRLILVARRRERLEELARELTAAGSRAEMVVLPCDLEDRTARADLLAEVERRGHAVDHLLLNAGFGVAGRMVDIEPARERAMVELNVVALHDLLVRCLPGMVERGYGRILLVGSTAGYQPIPFFATYSATKAFVVSLAEALGAELAGTGVTVTHLSPGKTDTEFFTDARMETAAFGKAPAASARGVAEAGYGAMLAGRRGIVPGFANKLSAQTGQRLPRRLVLAVSGRLFRPRH